MQKVAKSTFLNIQKVAFYQIKNTQKVAKTIDYIKIL